MQTDFSDDDFTPGEEVRLEPAGVAIACRRGAKHLMSSPYWLLPEGSDVGLDVEQAAEISSTSRRESVLLGAVIAGMSSSHISYIEQKPRLAISLLLSRRYRSQCFPCLCPGIGI